MTQKKYPAYKPSGVEWIGEIPEHWDIKRFKYFSTLKNGYAFKSEKYVEEGVPVIRIGDIATPIDFTETKKVTTEEAEELQEFVIYKGDILVALTGATIGKSCVYSVDDLALLNQRVGLVRPAEKVTTTFLAFLVSTDLFRRYIDVECIGGAQENIGKEQLGCFVFPLPPKKEQQAIASYLDKKTALIDSTIRQKERLIELLQEERKAIINQAVTRGLDPNVKMKDSGVEWLGQVPEHWSVQRFKYFTTLKNGYAFKSEKYVEIGVPVIRIGDISTPVDLNEAKKVSTQDAEVLTEFIISKGDILVALTGATIGKSCVYTLDDIALLNQRVGLVKPTVKATTSFLAYLISSELFRNYIDIECFGGAQENIGKEQLGCFEFPLPSDKEQHGITSYLDKKMALIDETVSMKKKEIALLQEYRTSLINEVVTGKRCVLDDPKSELLP